MKREKFNSFINPSGFLEFHLSGLLTVEVIMQAIEVFVKQTKKQVSEGKPALVLVDLSNVPTLDISEKFAAARKKIVETMMSANYDRVALFGPAKVQIVLNTLIIIAGKRDCVKVFSDRTSAVKWLKDGV